MRAPRLATSGGQAGRRGPRHRCSGGCLKATTGRRGTLARCGPRSSIWSTCASDKPGSVNKRRNQNPSAPRPRWPAARAPLLCGRPWGSLPLDDVLRPLPLDAPLTLSPSLASVGSGRQAVRRGSATRSAANATRTNASGWRDLSWWRRPGVLSSRVRLAHVRGDGTRCWLDQEARDDLAAWIRRPAGVLVCCRRRS